jgi:tryptophan synthase alpha chain
MSRLAATFQDKRKKLITFLMAGDPGHEESLALLKALPEAGADIIELGMPFTDPVADGPTIQAAGLRALAAGASMKRTLDMVAAFRQDNTYTPIVLMGYANPVMAYGWDIFARDAAASGVDGFIIVDLPPEEDGEFRALCTKNGLDLIRLLDETRLPTLLEGVSGFLYYVSVAGITGSGSANAEALRPHIAQIKALTDLPLAIGFGIKTPGDAKAMAATSEAVVVGSAIINALQHGGVDAAAALVQKLSTALK